MHPGLGPLSAEWAGHWASRKVFSPAGLCGEPGEGDCAPVAVPALEEPLQSFVALEGVPLLFAPIGRCVCSVLTLKILICSSI